MSRGVSRKSFGDLRDAEAFFHASCNEREAGANTLARLLAEQLAIRPEMRLLDFGGGDGRFLSEVFARIKLKPKLASLAVVDVDTSFYGDYVCRLQPVSETSISTHQTWPSGTSFDAISANHVLYYVENMQSWVARAVSLMAPNARAYIAMGCPGFPLSRLWRNLFALTGIDLPYLGTDALERELSRASLCFVVHRVPFRIAFHDNAHNRSMFLRFLVGEYYGKVAANADGLLDRFVDTTGKFVIEHQDWIYSVSKEWH